MDFEAFQHGNSKFHIKELCVMNVDKPLVPLYYIFKPHKAWQLLDKAQQKTYSYQQNHLHRLYWEEGQTRYCRRCIQQHIKDVFPDWASSIFYVVGGEQKVSFLTDEFPDIPFVEYNLSALNQLPSLPNNNVSCLYRTHGEHCALLKCLRLYTHYTTFT